MLKVKKHLVLYLILEFIKIKNLLFYPFVCHHYYFLCCHWRMPHSLSVRVSHCYLDFHSHWIHCCVQAVKNNRIYSLCTPAFNKKIKSLLIVPREVKGIYFRFFCAVLCLFVHFFLNCLCEDAIATLNP